MSLKASEIIQNLEKKIQEFEDTVETSEIGKVIQVGDGVAIVEGLTNAFNNELVIFDSGVEGIVLNLEFDTVGIALLGDQTKVYQGMIVKRTQKQMAVPTGDQLLGRVINANGHPIDGKDPLDNNNNRLVEKIASGVMSRKSVNEPMETGIKIIDSVIPIGKGQRELIIGDRKTGKTQIAIDTIINQKNKNVKCVYVAVGQKQSTVASIVTRLEKAGALAYTTIVLAGASDLAPLQYLAPYTGCAIGEAWMENGDDVLIVYDDLSKHASAYRTLSLLLRRPPGREAYPGDVFYLHSRLLERAAKLNDELGGGSMTALPIVETQSGDISAYIPTNVISITDGQIFLQTDLFNQGQRPAVDPGLSVSRVGSDAQHEIIKKLSGSIKLELAQYREMVDFAKFGSELDQSTKNVLDHGARLMEILKQNEGTPLSVSEEALILYAAKYNHLSEIPVEKVNDFQEQLFNQMNNNFAQFKNQIEQNPVFNNEIKTQFEEIIAKTKSMMV